MESSSRSRFAGGALFGLACGLLPLTGHAANGLAVSTTLGDQQSVAITVYNDGQGLVRDLRTVELTQGPFTLAWRDVASQINTKSVSLVDLTAADGVEILEQNYQYDLIDRSKLIGKYVGKPVQIQMFDPASGRTVTRDATLLAPDVIQIDGKIYPGIPGQLILPELPGGLISVPTLEWNLIGAGGTHDLAMSYLTGGMGWQADYVAVVNAEDTQLDLNGWTTITNNSGTTYTNATLKLVAGDVNRVQSNYPTEFDAADSEGLVFNMLAKENGFEEKSFFEYHLYTLGRPATLKNNEQKQIALLSATNVPARKRFIFEPGWDYLDYSAGATQIGKILVKMEFENRKEHNLGLPLPKGIVRVYKADTDGTLQFIGEDRIDHTPKDEPLRLLLGNAFDIAVERSVKERRKITDRIWEYDVAVKVRNHKTTTVPITVIDHVRYGDWTLTTHAGGDYQKRDASTLEFTLQAAPDVEQVLTYTIRREY